MGVGLFFEDQDQYFRSLFRFHRDHFLNQPHPFSLPLKNQPRLQKQNTPLTLPLPLLSNKLFYKSIYIFP